MHSLRQGLYQQFPELPAPQLWLEIPERLEMLGSTSQLSARCFPPKECVPRLGDPAAPQADFCHYSTVMVAASSPPLLTAGTRLEPSFWPTRLALPPNSSINHWGNQGPKKETCPRSHQVSFTHASLPVGTPQPRAASYMSVTSWWVGRQHLAVTPSIPPEACTEPE